MARKSRKETAAVAVQEADAACRAAIYVRLSVEDTHTHSVSIETQQMIIARYLEQYPEISVYDTYIDNGATGTNFHRPGFQQMLSDIEAGHVNCVIVKDLSRLGRNTIDTGYYIEQYFRIRSIRFIAVNENFDTANPEDAHSGIIIPLRNMINEAYALDIGRKIRAQQRQAMKDGKFIGARTPYGYLKAEDDCHQLIIDPVAAVVVQRMFRWASEGAGLNTIAVRLNEAGVLTPSHYKKMQGKITHENLLGSGKWQTRTVGVILRSEVYTGDLVQGQTKTVDHRQVRPMPRNGRWYGTPMRVSSAGNSLRRCRKFSIRPPAALRRERLKPSRRICSKARCSAPIAAAACTGRETSARSLTMCTSTIV